MASVPFIITNAQRAELRRRGMHPEVIRELRPADAKWLLDADPPVVPPNAAIAPAEDLRQLAATLKGLSSAQVARDAQPYAPPGVEVDEAVIDRIKAGGAAGFAVRDALWTALS